MIYNRCSRSEFVHAQYWRFAAQRCLRRYMTMKHLSVPARVAICTARSKITL